MIPVIIGAAVAVGAGAVIFNGNDKPKQPEAEKRQVSEDYVMRKLNRAGKNLQANYIKNFDERTERLKNIVDIVNYLYIKKVMR